MEHDAEYTIAVDDTDVSSTAKLTVDEKPAEFTIRLKDQKVMETETAEFMVQLTKPDIQVKWLKDDVELTGDDRVQIVSDGVTYKLVFNDTQMTDAGSITCLLPSGQKCRAKFTVDEKPVAIEKELTSIEVDEHQDATFEVVLNKPDQKVAWFVKGKKIKPSDKYIIESDGTTYRLTIKDCTLEDTADVKMTIKDLKSAAKLTVKELPIEFTKPLTDVECMEKDTIILSCETSKPNIPVKWYRNGDEIVTGLHYKLNGDGAECRLTVIGARVQDTSEYTCKIVSSENTTKAKLTVKELPVEVIIPLSDMETIENKTVTFECELSKPDQKVTWLKDGAELSLSDTHYKITSDEGKYTLTIFNCTLDDTAEYTIKCGDVSSSAKLTVGEAPTEITKPLEDMQTMESETISLVLEISKPRNVKWFKNGEEITVSERFKIDTSADGKSHMLTIADITLDENASFSVAIDDLTYGIVEASCTVTVMEKPVEITLPLKNIDAQEKDTVTFTCDLSKPGRQDGKWVFKGQEVTASEKFTITTDGCTQSLTIANVSLEDAGEVSYSIENASTSATLFVGELPVEFLTPLEDKKVMEKESVTF